MPVPETAAAVLAALRPRRRPLLDDMAEAIERLRGVRVPVSAFDLGRLPPHLRMTFHVEDDASAACWRATRTSRACARRCGRGCGRSWTAAAGSLERHGLTAWTIGTLPQSVTLPGTGAAVTAYPALVDEGATVGVRTFETPAAQRGRDGGGHAPAAAAHLPLPRPLTCLGPARADARRRLAVTSAVLDDATAAAVDALVAEAGGPGWDEAGFAALRGHVAGSLAERTLAIVDQVVADPRRARARSSSALEPLTAVPLQPARADVRDAAAPARVPRASSRRPERHGCRDVERYLRARGAAARAAARTRSPSTATA